jgi:hypothetical protein
MPGRPIECKREEDVYISERRYSVNGQQWGKIKKS